MWRVAAVEDVLRDGCPLASGPVVQTVPALLAYTLPLPLHPAAALPRPCLNTIIDYSEGTIDTRLQQSSKRNKNRN